MLIKVNNLVLRTEEIESLYTEAVVDTGAGINYFRHWCTLRSGNRFQLSSSECKAFEDYLNPDILLREI